MWTAARGDFLPKNTVKGKSMAENPISTTAARRSMSPLITTHHGANTYPWYVMKMVLYCCDLLLQTPLTPVYCEKNFKRTLIEGYPAIY